MNRVSSISSIVFRLGLVGLGLVVAGCPVSIGTSGLGSGGGQGSGSMGLGQAKAGAPENTAPPVNALEDAAHPGLESCTSGLTSAAIEDELAITRAFDSSMHEMIICGGLTVNFSVMFVDVLVNAALGKSTRPSAFKYLGDGRWDAGGIMTVSLHLPHDTSFGRAGDVIPFDVFDPESYFADLRAVAKASVDMLGNTSTKLELAFSDTGPGFELLGAVATSGKSLTLDFDEIVAALGQVRVRASFVGANDKVGDVAVQYRVRVTEVTIGSLIEAGNADTEIAEVTATREGSPQRIEVTRWGMAFGGGNRITLDGEVELRVLDGAFPYTAHFVYPHRKTPDIALACAP